MKKLSVLIALGFALSACGQGNDSKPEPSPSPSPTVEPAVMVNGVCLKADEASGDIVVKDENVVDCELAHSAEVLAIVGIPRKYFKTGLADQNDYNNLTKALAGERENTFQVRFANWATVVCEGAFQETSGLNEIELKGTSSVKARITPFAGSSKNSLMFESFDVWLKAPRLVCVNKFVQDSKVPDSELRTVTGNVTAAFLTAAEPLKSRSCLDRQGKQVSCGTRHHEERLFTFNAAAVFDAETVARMRFAYENDIPDLKNAALEQLASACVESFDKIIGPEWDQQNLRAGARFGSGWGDSMKLPRAICTVRPIDPTNFDLPPGSVFAINNAEVELLPRLFN